jgi:hypothetical protein
MADASAAPPWQRILLATEHTTFDVGAERLALELARRGNGKLAVVLPIEANLEILSELPLEAARLDDEAAGRRRDLLAAARAAGVDASVSVREEGELWRAIVAQASDAKADLVVIRRRGHRGFIAQYAFGESARAVAARAPCDVLVVPRAATYWTRAVVAAVDAARATERVAATAARVAAWSGLPLHVVSVAAGTASDARDAAEGALRRAAGAIAPLGLRAETMLRVGKAEQEIPAVVRDLGADLVVVGHRSSRDLFHLRRLGATAHGVIARTGTAVLVART